MNTARNIYQINDPAELRPHPANAAGQVTGANWPGGDGSMDKDGAEKLAASGHATGSKITVTPTIVPSLVSNRYTLSLRTPTHVWRKTYLSPQSVVADVEALRLVGEHSFDEATPLWLAIRRTFHDAIEVETSELRSRSFSRFLRSKRFREGTQ